MGYLKPTTIFLTFDVIDLYTMIPRDGALMAWEEFLCKHAQNGRLKGMTIDTLMKITMNLANIYMLKWKQPWVKHQKHHNEFYSRYIISNLSIEQSNQLLHKADQQDENIRIS